jgi:hypothetical protein
VPSFSASSAAWHLYGKAKSQELKAKSFPLRFS